MDRTTRLIRCAIVTLAIGTGLFSLPGCAFFSREYWEALKGDGFPGWSDTSGSGLRGSTKDAKPSGFFTDRRSEQIEKDLGGSF